MDNRPLLPRYPKSWYVLGLSRDLQPGDIQSLSVFGLELVLFRTASGTVSLFDAYCPHLGAHFGHGGSVKGESLRCPFHGFEFDPAGQCTYIPYGTRKPPKATAVTYPIQEKNGFILAYLDRTSESPTWEVPALEQDGWSELSTTSWIFRGHPQEVTENSVDIGHFDATHGYVDFELLEELQVDGTYLYSRYAMSRPDGLLGSPVRFNIGVHVHGLGYSQVDVHVEKLDIRARFFVLPTPLDGENICLRIAVSMSDALEPGKIHPLLRFVPKSIIQPFVTRETFKGFINDVQQDFEIWQNKRYIQPPILAAGDGPVGPYRQWAKQFYSVADQAQV